MKLEEYKKKRDLAKSPEPAARTGLPGAELSFVVQKHAATRLHYDFRLELDGVLKSWAVPKGPSLDPSVKRLAVLVEDHPYEYRNFEGTIPKGNYGAGEVIIWDQGSYHAPGVADRQTSEKLLREGFYKGDLKFVVEGHKLKGEFALVKIKADKDNSWLLIKKKDAWSSSEDVTRDDGSVVSGAVLRDAKAEVKETPAPSERPLPVAEAAAAGLAAAMPRDVKPMLATLVSEPFDHPDWIFEIKQDGYRAIAEIEQGAVRLYSRKGTSFNRQFASIVRSLESIPGDAVVDGELVALDDKGRSYFQLLQNHLRAGSGNLSYFLFDLLYLNGKDLRDLPLLTRKQMLRDLLPELPDLRYNDHIEQYGSDFFELARANNLEGIVAKQSSSRYQAGKRSKDWLKIKIRLQQEALVCGFTEPRGSRKKFGTLVLGAYEGNKLVPIGFSGGGFADQSLHEIHEMLQPLVQADSPFSEKVKSETRITWVRPVLVCEVAFSEWTDEKIMRQPVFLGLRDDKDPETVVRELPPTEPARVDAVKAEVTPPKNVGGIRPLREKVVSINGHRIKLTNLDKVFWPEENYTKGDVIDYYRRVAGIMLPYLKDRPESLYRTPEGMLKVGFFQKEAGELPPDWVTTREIYSDSGQKNIRFFICQDEATLVYLANLGCVEINPWLSRLQNLDFPDYFVIDLDPEEIPFDRVIDAALAVGEILDKAGATGYPKTSGATGMHIYVPLQARYDYETAGKFAQLVATLVHQRIPSFTSLVRDPRKRQGKVYLDFLQNKSGATLAAPYSIRPRPGATVSTPLKWDEVKIGLDPGAFTIKTMVSRLERVGDLFAGVLGPGIDMESCLENLERAPR